jgi:hypothetical protein
MKYNLIEQGIFPAWNEEVKVWFKLLQIAIFIKVLCYGSIDSGLMQGIPHRVI